VTTPREWQALTVGQARLNQEVARQGFLPFQRLLASNAPFGSPLGGLLVHYVPTVLVIILPPSRSVYSFIVDVESYAGLFFGLAVSLGLLVLRQRRPDLQRPFKAWLPAVYVKILLSVGSLIAPLFPPKNGTGDVDFFYAAYAVVAVVV
jgi:amino acid transporter